MNPDTNHPPASSDMRAHMLLRSCRNGWVGYGWQRRTREEELGSNQSLEKFARLDLVAIALV